MVGTQTMLIGASGNQNPVDYYAGISALCIVIMFAKFTTYDSRRRNPQGGCQEVPHCWWVVHIASVALAALGALLSLVMLGWGEFFLVIFRGRRETARHRIRHAGCAFLSRGPTEILRRLLSRQSGRSLLDQRQAGVWVGRAVA
jgi:hypothetical protein